MNSRKVVFVHHSGQLGGAPKSLGYLLEYLGESEYRKFLVNVYRTGPIQDVLRRICSISNTRYINAFRIRPFHGSAVAPNTVLNFLLNVYYFLPSLYRSYKMLKRLQPDLVYLNSSCLFVIALACKIRIRRIKVICHLREPMRRSVSGAITSYVVSHFCDGLVSISQADLKSYGRQAELLPNRIIHNVTKFEEKLVGTEIQNNLRDVFNIGLNDVVYLYLGRFAKGNGVENLVEIAERITSTRRDFHFVLAGAIPSDKIEANGNPNIHILPYQKNIEWLLKGSDVFVCPFTEPHFSRGVVEASTYGLPSIARSVGAINELILHEETGFLCHDDAAIEFAVIKLGEDTLLRNVLGKKAIKFANANFNPEIQLSTNASFIENFLPGEVK